MEEAEEMLRELFAHADGFHEVTMVDGNTVVSLAQFHSPVQAMKFVRSHKKNEQIQEAGVRKPKQIRTHPHESREQSEKVVG